MNNIICLESHISEAFLEGKYVCAIFYNLEKAYDKTKRDLVIDTAAAAGIHGNTLKYIINFLKDRKFRVCINNNILKEHVLENGLPQGSTISVTLFLIAINTITKHLSPYVEFLIYADDLIIFNKFKSPKQNHELMKKVMNNLKSWMKETEFKFSAEKTKAMLLPENIKSNHYQLLK